MPKGLKRRNGKPRKNVHLSLLDSAEFSMLAALILAAGESRRMGSPKATLPFPTGEATPGKVTFLDHLVSVVQRPRVGLMRVVLGASAETIQKRVHLKPDWIVHNPDWARGQLSSIQAGIRSLPEATDGILLCPVDTPLISSALVDQLVKRFYETGKPIVLTVHRAKRGHPVIFSRALFGELLGAPLDQGAKAVVNAHRQETLEIDTEDVGVTLDIDTPELYRQHVKGE